MSVSLENGVVGECVELVDDLRIHDIQVTGLSVPILVRADANRNLDQNEFVENSLSDYSLRNLTQYTESICKDLPINLISVLFQHNANPILGYSSGIDLNCIKKGGEEENQICSRLAAIFSEVSAPNIVKQLSWFYLFDHKLEFLLPDWNKMPLVLYMLYTVSPIEEQVNQPLCEPTTKWIFCLHGKIIIQLLPPTPGNFAVLRKFLDSDNEDALSDLFQSDSIETHLYKNQVIFIPAGWIYFARRETQTIEYGGEFFHSFAIEHQFGVWHLYKETFLRKSDQTPPPFFTCHWLVLQAYLSSFQHTMLTTQEALFDIQHSRAYLPHFSPFECRGMLFLIELIRSGRLPLLRQCIPSTVNCAVSLLQKMQTILLHETIFSAFSCSTPNGIMFFGTPKDDSKLKYKSKKSAKKSQAKHSSLPVACLHADTTSVPERLAFSSSYPVTAVDVTDAHEDSSMSISISLDKIQVSPEETNDVTFHETGSPASNYQALMSNLSKSPNIPSIHSCYSEQSRYLEKETSPTATCATVREFLESLISRSVLNACGFCQICKNRGFVRNTGCVLKRIANLQITPNCLIKAPPILNKLVQYLSVYPPIAPYNDYLNDILRKKEKLTDSRPSTVTGASLSDIQDIMAQISTYSCGGNLANPVGHSTPLGSPSK